MTLPRQWQKHVLALVERGGALEGDYFRSVELSYAHPDDVVSGEGTRVYGGRFVKPGVRAVYGSVDEPSAVRESAARKARLIGGGIPGTDYPRITYVIAVKLTLHIDLTVADTDTAAIRPACLDAGDLSASQEVGEFCRRQSVHGILYPSAISASRGTNLVVFRDVATQPQILLVNRDQIIEQLRRLADRSQ